ncbi:MAG TPA: M14 family metallopeptidase, partial [Planctomycetota bacterium]|nr:M14 family metallopeptidase [Planctomycetota bacterium]
LRALEKAYPKFLSLTSIGKSIEGRDLWVMRILQPETGPEASKAAMYIDANIHGNEVQGTEVCLYTISYLMENYSRLPRVRELVDERVFYVLPMVNPDGRAWWFTGPNTQHSSRSGKQAIDDDGDGQYDEDGFDDIDGDGEVLGMWKADPHGDYKRNPEDARLLVRTRPGETGEFIYLGLEGIDNDGDGQLNEDPPGGYDMNRNWPADWLAQPHQYGSGPYPLNLPETRSIAEFILAHPNIAGVQAYHNAGGMILRGPGDSALGEYPPRDVRVYDKLGQTGEFMLPFYRYMILWRDLYAVHGGFINWTFEELGIFSFTNEIWNTGQYRNAERESLSGFDRESVDGLKWDDLLELGSQFVPLKPAQHPLYGEILLGGFRKMAGRMPPLFLLEELCHRNAAFTLYHASEMPRVRVRSIDAQRIAGDASQVTLVLENLRAIPSRSGIAAAKRLGEPDVVELSGPNARVLASGVLTDKFQGLFDGSDEEPARVKLDGGVPGNDSVSVRFIVRGSGQVEVKYTSEKGGRLDAKVVLP